MTKFFVGQTLAKPVGLVSIILAYSWEETVVVLYTNTFILATY